MTKEEEREYKKNWAERNKEKVKESAEKYRKHNIEKIRAKGRVWQAKKRELARKNKVCLRCKKQDERTLDGKTYCAECAEKADVSRKEYKREHPEKVKEYNRRRYEKQLAKHICTNCKTELPQDYKKTKCPQCLETLNRKAKEKRAAETPEEREQRLELSRAKRRANRKNRLCTKCGLPLPEEEKHITCAKCREKQMEDWWRHHIKKSKVCNYVKIDTELKRRSKKRYDEMVNKNPMNLRGFETWLREKELAENTVKSYVSTMLHFGETYDEFTKENALKYKRDSVEKNLKPQTINHFTTVMEQYSIFLEAPIKLKRVKEQKRSSVDNVMDEKTFKGMTERLKKDGRDMELINIMLLAMTGARISEALKITKKDVLRGSVDLFTKGKVRTINIPKKLKEFLEPYMQEWSDDERVMRKRVKKEAASSSAYIQKQIQQIGIDYDIPLEYMHPHAFRHYFAMRFLEKNNNMFLLADLLGHSGVNTTMIYARMSHKQQKQALDEAVDWDI